MVRGSKIWNSLPAELRMINKVDKFKKGLRQSIRDRVGMEWILVKYSSSIVIKVYST